MSLRAPAAALLAASLSLFGSACAPRTQILVWVWSDIDTTGSMGLSRLQVHIASAGAPTIDRTYTLGRDDGTGHVARVPGVIVVAYPHDNQSSAEVTIDVTPLWGNATTGGNLWPQPSHHVVRFRPGHTDLLPIYLAGACATNTTCNPASQTCSLHGCEAAATTLTDFDGTYPIPGASMDGGYRFCDAGFSNCSGTCVDLMSSVEHCGTCSNTCGAGMTCTDGMCVCMTGTNCDGGCVDTHGDPNHCGTCGTVCPADAQCVNGACGCLAGFRVCGGQCVDINQNCGTCGHACLNGTCVNDVCRCLDGITTCTSTQYCCSRTSCC